MTPKEEAKELPLRQTIMLFCHEILMIKYDKEKTVRNKNQH